MKASTDTTACGKALKTLLITCLLGHVISPLAFCWSSTPHSAIALIAQNRLSAPAKLEIQNILGKDTGLAQLANCPDEMLGSSIVCANILPLEKNPGTISWHFVNIPSVSISPNAGDLERICNVKGSSDNCAIGKIRKELAVLKNPAASRTDRQAALMFIVHLVGDLHQPMHATTEYQPDGSHDFGGGKKAVTYVNVISTSTNLHRLWDNMIMSFEEAEAMDYTTLAKSLGQDLSQKDVSSWTSGDIVTGAALESFKIAKDVVYPSYYNNPGHVYDLQFHNRMQPIIRERLEKAGVRLAFLLEQAFLP